MTTFDRPIAFVLPKPRKEKFTFRGLSAVAVMPFTSSENDWMVRLLPLRFTPLLFTSCCEAVPASMELLIRPPSVP